MQVFFLALVALLPLVRALSIDTPTAAQGWIGNSTVNITWSTIAGDPPVFSIELTRPNQNLGPYNGALAVANNVPVAQGELSFELPAVPPGGGYIITFINITDINIVYATSQTFTVVENDATSTTTTMPSTTATLPTGTVSSGTTASATTTSMSTTSSSSMSTSSTSATATPTSFSAASSITSPSFFRSLGTACVVLGLTVVFGRALAL